jgi:hypothetical protein
MYMGNFIKLMVLGGVVGCYMWYLGSMQTAVNAQLSQLTNLYAHANEIASQSSK